MKIRIHGYEEGPKVMEADVSGRVVLSEVFNAVVIVTEDGARYGVALRDSGLEIACPDETLVGVKRYGGGETLCEEASAPKAAKGQTFVERNGEVLG